MVHVWLYLSGLFKLQKLQFMFSVGVGLKIHDLTMDFLGLFLRPHKYFKSQISLDSLNYLLSNA